MAMGRGTACGLSILAMAILAGTSAPAVAAPEGDEACLVFRAPGRLDPEDYRKPSARLRVVEDYHFGPNVEALARSMQRGVPLGSDLDYTLWGYPNHHRALVALVRLGEREKTDKPNGANFTIDCYFRRGLRVAPDDGITRMLYAQYLGKQGRREDALRNLDFVVQNAGENPFTHYNAGLLYFELKAYPKAVAQAKRSEALGFPRADLRESLKRAGEWPPEDAAAPASAPASSDAPSRP